MDAFKKSAYYTESQAHFWQTVKQGKGFGHMGTGTPPTDDLTSFTRDALFLFQLEKPDPTALDAESLFTAKIVETRHYGKSVYNTLKKHGILDAADHPDTTKIDKTMVSKIGILSVPKQRELVNMLFFWEEEVMRWRVLDEEMAAINASSSNAAEGEDVGTLERLAVVGGEKRVVPSMREADGTVKEGSAAPPQYKE